MTEHEVPYEELMKIAFGPASTVIDNKIGEHVAQCTQCQASILRAKAVQSLIRFDTMTSPRVESVNRVLNIIVNRAPQPKNNSLGVLQRVFAALTFDSRQRYAASGLRGGSDAYLLSFAHEDATLDLEIEPSTGAETGVWHITGQLDIAGLSESTDIAIVGGRGAHAATNSDEFGVFSFSVEPGRYDMLVSLETATLVFPEIEVGERDEHQSE